MDENAGSIGILTEYFNPDSSSTARLITELAVDLEETFDVSVITAPPRYHEQDRERPPPRSDIHRGIDVKRVRATRFDKDVNSLRVVNWLSFVLLATVRLLRGDRRDALLVLSNPPILPLVAWIDKRLRGTPYVYLVYDMYPDMPVALGILSGDSLVVRAWEGLMCAIYRDADRIVVLGEAMRRRLTDKMDEDPRFDTEAIEVIPNWEDEEFIVPRPKSENEFAHEVGTRDRFTVLYSGNIGRYHELETTIDAIGVLEERRRTDIELLIIGDGARKDELRRRANRHGIDGVRFLPFQPIERLPETLTCADASLVGVLPEVEGMCVSSKLYSSLAAGMPVLAVSSETDEVGRIVEEAECGARVGRRDVGEVADVLEYWADTPQVVEALGENARECFERDFTRDDAVEAYRDLFETLID